MIVAIFAIDDANGMGLDNTIPWPFNKEDMAWFKRTTMEQVVVMGSNTWNSTNMLHPLPNRVNVVFSNKNKHTTHNNVIFLKGSVVEELCNLESQYPNNIVYVIGGPNLLLQAEPVIDKVLLTRIQGDYNCNVTLHTKHFLKNFKLIDTMNFKTCKVEEYERIP